MRVLVVGLGYVGLSNALSFSRYGHEVVGTDLDEGKIESLKKGVSPIAEKGFVGALKEGTSVLWLHDYELLGDEYFDAAILCVPTPMGEGGTADLSYLHQAVEGLLRDGPKFGYLFIRSTVPPLTATRLMGNPELKGRIVSNPEFLRQGTSYEDELNPERVVVGVSSKEAEKAARELYTPLIDKGVPFIVSDNTSAELGKYACNDFLAMKISFINEMSVLCEEIGGNVKDVARILGSDKRIGNKMLEAGIGYGGSCFPKDTPALIELAKEHGVDLPLEKGTVEVNEHQRRRFIDRAVSKMGEFGIRKVGLLGLSFKKNTPDVRSSVAIDVARALIEKGYEVLCYDSLIEARKAFKAAVTNAEVKETMAQILNEAEALLILNDDDWGSCVNESTLKSKSVRLVYDGRNVLSDVSLGDIEYLGIGIRR